MHSREYSSSALCKRMYVCVCACGVRGLFLGERTRERAIGHCALPHTYMRTHTHTHTHTKHTWWWKRGCGYRPLCPRAASRWSRGNTPRSPISPFHAYTLLYYIFVCVCASVCGCVCSVCVKIHTHTHTHTHTHIICVCLYMYTHTYKHNYMHTCTSSLSLSLCTCTSIHILNVKHACLRAPRGTAWTNAALGDLNKCYFFFKKYLPFKQNYLPFHITSMNFKNKSRGKG